MTEIKKYTSEFIGTFVLVFVGCGSAVFLGATAMTGHLAVAFAFGLSIVAMAYVIGNISGCHINPAVSLAMLLRKKLSIIDFIGYVGAQVLGAIAAAGLLSFLLSQSDALIDRTNDTLGSNGIGSTGLIGGIIVEVVLTFIFIFVILGVTSDEKKDSVAGIVIGLTLTFVHIIGIPLTGTSVNPARSIGPALFAGGDSLADVWVFIVGPLVGAVLAVGVFCFLNSKKKANKE